MFTGRELCRRAALAEPAIVFPNLIFTQILEARHRAGTVAVEAELLHFSAQTQLGSQRDYMVYLVERRFLREDEGVVAAQWRTSVDGHAGEQETSMLLVIRPDLMDRSQLRADGEGLPLDRLNALREAGVYTGLWWYADHPTHYRGDGTVATTDNGEHVLQSRARALVAAIQTIKQDDVARQLQAEYYAAANQD